MEKCYTCFWWSEIQKEKYITAEWDLSKDFIFTGYCENPDAWDFATRPPSDYKCDNHKPLWE